MLPLVKKVIPGSLKDKIKSINRDRRLDAAMNQLAAVSMSEAPGRDVLTEGGSGEEHSYGERAQSDDSLHEKRKLYWLSICLERRFRPRGKKKMLGK